MTGASFGATVREVRQIRKLSLRKLARHAAISATYLAQLEEGRHVPSERVVHALADALECSVGVLLATTGRIPEDVLQIIRERPIEMERLVRSAAAISGRKLAVLADLMDVDADGS